MEFDKILNKEQLAAVYSTEGPVLVVAGAGSGKTRVLTYRIAYLIKQKNISPYNILAITFTNKATNEMKERLQDLIGDSYGLWVSTFHSLCARILRKNIELLGYSKDFTIYGEIETQRVMKRVIKNKHLEEKAYLNKALWHISNAKNKGFSPEEYTKEGFTDSEVIFELYEAYENELRKSNALDYDDLLLKTVLLFTRHSEVLEYYQQRFIYIHIDEYQDTNRIQYMLVKMLSKYYGNIFAVGDEDQSIYGWRGADINNILDFKKDYPDSKIYKLEQNYRSTTSILKAANALINCNKGRLGKTLWTDKGEGVRVEMYRAGSDREEADYVIRNIVSLINQGYKPSDFAILVRVNAITSKFEERLNLYNIPFKVFGGFKFFERKEIKDVIAYFRVIVNPRDNEALLRIINVPKRGIGDMAIGALMDYCNTHDMSIADALLTIHEIKDISPAIKKKYESFVELLSKLLYKSSVLPLNELAEYVVVEAGFDGYYDKNKEEDYNKLLNIDELLKLIEDYAKENPNATLSDYLQSVSLMSDTDDIKNDNFVTVATVHAVKGLEFSVVFIVGLEENIFPSGIFNKNPSEIEEERRVMYVAMTRAEQRLYLTHATMRYRFGREEENLESRFLKEIKAEIYPQQLQKSQTRYIPTQINPQEDKRQALLRDKYNKATKAAVEPKNAVTVAPGQVVIHAKYGEGMVISANGDNASIAFEGLGVKQFNMTYAPIKLKG